MPERNRFCFLKHAWAAQYTQSFFFRQVATTALAQGTTLVFSLATATITARWLGPAGKGELAMIFMVSAMLQMFLSLGLGPANVYFIGSGRFPIHQLSANSVAFSILGTIAGLLVMLAILMGNLVPVLLPGVSSDYLMLGMIALPLSLQNGYMNALLQGLRRIYMLNIIIMLGSLLHVMLMAFLLIVLKLGILGAIVASLAVQIGILLATSWRVKQEGGRFWPELNPQVTRPTLIYGLKCYVGSLLQFFSYRMDVFIVNFFIGPAAVGIYGVSVVMAELLWQLPNAASFVIFPKSANSTKETMNRFTPRVFWIILSITTLGAIVLALLGRLAISVIFSSAFLDAYMPLLVLLPGVVLLGSAKILTNDIAGRGYPHYNSITSSVSLVATIVLDLLLIPLMGVVGAALASTLSYTLTFVISIGFYRSVGRIK